MISPNLGHQYNQGAVDSDCFRMGTSQQEGDLVFWWNSTEGHQADIGQRVNSVEEAVLLRQFALKYDEYVHEYYYNNGLYVSAGGLKVFDGTELVDWVGENGETFDEFVAHLAPSQ